MAATKKMTCPNMKRKFEEVEQAVHSCIESLPGYEKCLLQNKLLLARSKMVKYENVAITYETQVAMAKLDVEIATSDIDLLLQELQRGKRFKTGEAITISTSTQTDSQPTISPTESVTDTSRISADLPSVDLTSFSKKRSDKIQESSTSQGSKDSGYSSSPKRLLISQETATGYNSSPNGLVSREIQIDSFDTKEGDTETVNSPKKCKSKKKVSGTKDKPETYKKPKNEKLKPTKEGLPSDEIETNSVSKDKPTYEKPSKFKGEDVNEKTKKIDNTRKKSVQRRQSQNDKHRGRDARKSGSYDRRNSAESQKETIGQCDSHKDLSKHREKTDERKKCKEKYETKLDEKQNSNRNCEGIKLKSRQTSKSQNVGSKDNRNSSDNDKSDKVQKDNGHKEAKKKTDLAQNKSELSQKNSEPAQKTNLNRKRSTDLRIKKNEPIKAKYESQKPNNRSNDITLVIAEKNMEVETRLPNQVLIEDFAPYEVPHDSPIHYTDFANTILSSVAVIDASNTTSNAVGVLNSQNTIAQSTPFVRRFASVENFAPECQDSPSNMLCSDSSIEDQLTTFIKTTLADYNTEVTKLNLKQDTHTIINKDTTINCKTTDINNKKTTRDKTTEIKEGNTSKDKSTKINDKSLKINEENCCKIDITPKTPEMNNKNITKQNIMVKIPVTKVPDAISHINPTVVKIPVTRVPMSMNQITSKVKQPCLTVAVNDAGVITIRPRSAENSNQPSPKPEKAVPEIRRLNIQDKVHSTTLLDPEEPTITTAKEIFRSQAGTTSKSPVNITKHVEMPTETASYMTQVKDQYYFDIDSPKLADEAPTHKNAVNLFRAFSLLMPPSPTFTLSSLSDKENCKSSSPSPPQVQKLPINKKLLDDFVPSTFQSYKNVNTTGSKNDGNTNHSNVINNIYKNIKPMSVRRTQSTAEVIPRRTIKLTEAQPLLVHQTKSTTSTLRAKANRRKSLDDRAIIRVLNEPSSSVSSKGSSPRSIQAPTPKKKGLSLIDYFASHDMW